jgi:arabinofuranan 3-O-arabinosyltransferase
VNHVNGEPDRKSKLTEWPDVAVGHTWASMHAVKAVALQSQAVLDSTRRLSAASGIALLLGLGLLPEGNLADRFALIALVALFVATTSGWLQLLLIGRHTEREVSRVNGRTSSMWLLGATAVVAFAGIAAQTWFRQGTTLAGGDDVVPNGTAWIGRLFEPWIWDGATLGAPSTLPLALPRAVILGLNHALGSDPAIAHRILETTLFVGAGLAALGLLASLRTGPIAASVGAIVYLFNPYVVTWVSPHDVYLAAYCVLPAIPAVLVAVGRERISVCWGAALVAATAPLIGYSFFDPPLAGVILAAMFSAPLIVAWIDGKKAGLRSLRALLGAILFLLATSAYWTVPAIIQLGGAHLSSTEYLRSFNWLGGELRTTVRNAFWLNTRWLWIAPEYFPYAKTYEVFPLSALRFVLPALAFTALALPRIRYRDRRPNRDRSLRLAVAVATVSLFIILLSTGTNPPGNFIFDRLYALPFGWLLQEPDRFIMVVALAYAILVAIVVQAGVLNYRPIKEAAGSFRISTPTLQSSIAPLALVTAIAIGYPLYTGALVPDGGRPLPTWANHARPQHIQEPAYWPEMARFVDSLPIQGAVLVMPPDDFYEMPYTWYYGADSFIPELFNRHVLVPSYPPSELVNAVDLTGQSILRKDWHQAEALVRALDAPLVLVRRDIVTPYPNHSILPPNDLATALNTAPNFVLVRRIGLLDLYSLRNTVADPQVGPNFVMIDSDKPDLRLLSLLPPGTALVTGESRGGDSFALQAPPLQQWQLRGDAVVWQPPLRSGSIYRMADLGSMTVVPLDRSGTFVSDSTQVVYSPSSDPVTALLAIPGSRAAISNGDFNGGPWGPVSDCNAPRRASASVAQKLYSNGAPGGLPALRLSATLGIACVSKRLDWRGGAFLLSVMAHRVEGAAPRVCVWETGPNRCASLPSIGDMNDWANYQASVVPDAGTTAITVYLYADAGQTSSPTTSEYSRIRVVEVPSLPSVTVDYSASVPDNSLSVTATGRIAISNGDFTQGVWGPVSDCHAIASGQGNERLSANVLANAAPGGLPALALSAFLDSACEVQALDWHGGPLLINMMVNHLTGARPRLCLWETGPERCATLPDVPDMKGWSTYKASVSPDAGTTALSVYLYADGSQSGGLTTNQYAGVQVVEVPAQSSLALLADPNVVLAPTHQLVVVHSSYSGAWQGPTNSRHVLVDGMLNGWMVPIRAATFSAYYKPATAFNVAAWVSLVAYLILFLLGVRTIRSRAIPWLRTVGTNNSRLRDSGSVTNDTSPSEH